MTYLARARQRIPSGTQTYSKSHTRFPAGAPEYIVRAEGAYVYDASGQPWLDCVSGLGSVILGHADPEVNAAARKQLLNGVAYPLPSLLELSLAERICQLIPSAQMVRFGKNGADACEAAVRIARAVTGREQVVSIGYHGYHDWTIAHQNPRGVPRASGEMLTVVPYGDLPAMAETVLAAMPACLIMEPIVATNPVPPPDGYLEAVRDLCTQTGTILIFDEVVTFGRMKGFSAQAHYGVTPDLTALGKCLANGLPLSAVCGRADLMRSLEEGVFFSTTFGGETVSLAAAIATLDTLVRERIDRRLDGLGRRCIATWLDAVRDAGLGDRVTLLGYPSRLVWQWTDPEDAKLFGEALIGHRVLCAGYVNFTAAFHEGEMAQLERAVRAGCEVVTMRERAAA